MADTANTTTLPQVIDWAVTIALVLSGALALVFGWLLYAAADRPTIAALIADDIVHSDFLTDPELVDVTYALTYWGGIGLLVAGVLLVVAGITYLRYRHHARRRDPARTTWTNAVIGAAITLLTSALPLSPILGGAITGYLDGGTARERTRIGGLAGALAAIPIAVVFLFLIGAFAIVATELSLGTIGAIGIVGLVIGFIAAALYLIGLSAVGAYLTTHLQADTH